MIQTTIFDAIYPKYKITKPIRLIELFGGYGSQALALKYLGVEFQHWRLVEWAVKSIQAYKDIHFNNDNINYSKDLTKENIIDILHYLGISSNYNEPMTLEQIKRLNETQLRLEELGYKNYWQDLIATDYGIPQTRNRCFMVSILGDYSYSFPPKQELKLKLKDMLEDNVDEKYYLSDKQIEDIQHWQAYEKPLENMEKTDKNNISPTLTTRSGAYAAGMILVKNANSKGYLEAAEGDEIDISSRMKYHRGNVQKGKAQTLSTIGGENVGVVSSDLRIRKLTPKECFRLMGIKDEDYENCAKNQSNASLYHLAGDSIVVNVLMAIFKEML